MDFVYLLIKLLIEHFFLVDATKSIQSFIRFCVVTIHFSELLKFCVGLNNCLLLLPMFFALLFWLRPLYYSSGSSHQLIRLSWMLMHNPCNFSIWRISISEIRIYTFYSWHGNIINWVLMADLLRKNISLVLLQLVIIICILFAQRFFLCTYSSGFCIRYFCQSRVILRLSLNFKFMVIFSTIFWMKELAVILVSIVGPFGFNLIVIFVISLYTFFGSLRIDFVTIILINILILYFNLIVISFFVSVRHF